MMQLENIKALGFKEMHQMQIDSLLDFVATTINIAASIGDEEILEEIEAQSDELIKMFGGNGLLVTLESGSL
tara:strand:- start:5191 stop:5406 length:216 start_codon:yes stop_codon:yes gene_type:complete